VRPDDTAATAQPTYLITGATGFLGRHVLEALRRIVPRARLIVLVRDAATWNREPWRDGLGAVDVVSGELTASDAVATDPRLARLDGIFHLAAQVKHSRRDTAAMIHTNIEGTLGMVRLAARKKCRLVFVSSSGTVSCASTPGKGADERAPFCESVVGRWPYYASKIRAETEARRLAQQLGVELVIMRPPVLLGPGDHRYRSTSNVLRVLRRRLPFILPGGMHFVDVRDVADAIVRAMRHPAPQPVYHLVGTASSLDGFFRMIAAQAGLQPSWTVLPARLVWWLARINELAGSPTHMLPDPVVVEMGAHYWDLRSSAAEADLGYRSRAPEETIADTVAWMRQNHVALRRPFPTSTTPAHAGSSR
jgi:dihydroflavonol-4-reductase